MKNNPNPTPTKASKATKPASGAKPAKPKREPKPKPPSWEERPDDPFVQLCEEELGLPCVVEYRFHPTRRWRFDYAIPSEMIAVEQEGGVWSGGRHITPKGFLADMEKYNAATVCGWRVLRLTPAELCSQEAVELIRSVIHGYSFGGVIDM